MTRQQRQIEKDFADCKRDLKNEIPKYSQILYFAPPFATIAYNGKSYHWELDTWGNWHLYSTEPLSS